MHRLKGDRNANRILNDMSAYLNSFRNGWEKVYTLNKAGRERVQCTTTRKKTPNVQHFLIRNQLYIYWKRPKSWENEVKMVIGKESIVADAMFKYKDAKVFVEVDVSQPMATNSRKIEKYAKMLRNSQEPFFLIWVTELESRRATLNRLMNGLPGQVYTLNEIL